MKAVGMPDLILPYKRTDDETQLKYTLRSLAQNLPETYLGKLIIVGDKPTTITPDLQLPGNPSKDKWFNVAANVRIGCDCNQASDDVLIINDDMFLTDPLDTIPLTYRCSLQDHCKLGGDPTWKHQRADTLTLLTNLHINNPLSYELHIPLPCRRRIMAETLTILNTHPETSGCWRTIYGNITHSKALHNEDVKIYHGTDPIKHSFTSCTDASWTGLKPRIMKMFTTRSRWEN